jgi:hypothetical protein
LDGRGTIDDWKGSKTSLGHTQSVRVLRRPVIRPDVQLLRLAIVAEGGELIGKEGPASKVLSGTYENVAEVGTSGSAIDAKTKTRGYTTK